MKIADYSRVWTTHSLGGMQVRAYLAATGLARRGHEVHVFTTSMQGSKTKEARDSGLFVHYVDGTVPTQYKTEYFDRAFRLFQELGGFDLVHSNSSAGRRHLGGPLPVVATWHGIGTEQDDLNLVKIGGPQRTSKFDDSIGCYDHSIVVGPHERRLLLSQGIPEDRVHLVLPGLDETKFVPDEKLRQGTRQRLKLDHGDFVIGLSGRLVFDKGFGQIAAAAPKIDQGVKLLVVGSGPSLGGLKTSFGNRLVYAGARDHSEMPAFYNAMDLFLNPTARNQGFDLTTVEAMLCGTPVLASDIAAAREVFVRGAEFFELGNIDHLAAQANRLAHGDPSGAFGRDARKLAERLFTRERMLDEMEAVFRAALSGR
jgi:glycosyltransferase involved in cell wall biosynthesis